MTACDGRTRHNGFKLKEGRFRLDVRKTFFTLRVVRPWHRLPTEAAAAPSLGEFEASSDGALSNLVWWKVSLPIAGWWWNFVIFKGPFQPEPVYGSM